MTRTSTSKSGKLSDEAKAFVVSQLAIFEPASVVHRELKAKFGVDVVLQTVERYNPHSINGARTLAKKWKILFAETRQRFIDDFAAHGIAHKAWRLKQLQKMAEQALERQNFPLAASLLEQGAKEVGNVFTNKHELTGKDGKDLPPAMPTVIQFVAPNVDGND